MTHTCWIDDTLCPQCTSLNSRGVFTATITTRNGRYIHTYDSMRGAWEWVQGMVAVTNDAHWEVVSEPV
jgi:hypothetical protein